MSKLPQAMRVEPSSADRRAVRPDAGLELVTIVHQLSRAVQIEEPLGSNYIVAADFNPLGMLRNQLRAVGSAHIQSFRIFKNVSLSHSMDFEALFAHR